MELMTWIAVTFSSYFFYGLCFLFLGVLKTALFPKKSGHSHHECTKQGGEWERNVDTKGSGVRGELNQGIQTVFFPVSNEKTLGWLGYKGVSKNRDTPKWMVYNGNHY